MPKTIFRGHVHELVKATNTQKIGEWLVAFCRGPAHEEIRNALTEAGFEVKRIEKEEVHHVWDVRMKRGTAVLAPDYRPAVRQLRKWLVAAGIDVERDALFVVQSRDRIQCVFNYAGGEEGVWY